MIAHLKTQLANFKVPKRIHFVSDLPRNAMGKVQKNILRQQLSRGGASRQQSRQRQCYALSAILRRMADCRVRLACLVLVLIASAGFGFG